METVPVITHDILFKVLKNIFLDENIEDQEIEKVADYVLAFFGFGNSIIDNILTPADRDLFYMLEEYGILKTEMEEIILVRGKNWRIHYWEYRKDKILEYLNTQKKKKKESPEDIYKKIFESKEFFQYL